MALTAASCLAFATCSGDRTESPGPDLPPVLDIQSVAETFSELRTDERGELPIPPEVVFEDDDGNSVTITTSPLTIVGRKNGEVVWDGADAPISLGVVAQYDSQKRYDPEFVSDGVEWVALENPVSFQQEDSGAVVLIFEPQPGRKYRLGVEANSKGIVTFEFAPLEWDGEVLAQVSYLSKDPAENFYGLGEAFDRVAKRGSSRQMHMSVDFEQESGYNEVHIPIPLLISTNGSGIFVEDRHPGLFDVCDSDAQRVRIRFSTSTLKFHLLFAPTPLDVLTRYVHLAGNPALPPQWAFGILQWQDEIDGQDAVMDDAHAMRDLDLPCSAIWIDRPFATAHESFVFDPTSYPDSAQMVKDLNALGYRLAIWSAPYLSEDLAEEYAEAEKNGYFVVSNDVHFEKFGTLMDFTNPGAVELWQGLISNATDIGIEGFKLDYGEDVQSGFMELKIHFQFFNGEAADTMHHWYSYFYHQTYREMLEGDAFLINRAGCYGDQTITSVVWPGDLCANFNYHGEDGHVGGLPAAIIADQTLSSSGYPFFGSDTGGYRHHRPTKEVLLRWVQHTALTPVLQYGGAGENCNPWDFTLYEGDSDGEHYVSQYDEETLDIWRQFARLHIRLFPYVYTYAVQATLTGIPVTRPFGMVHPELNQHPDFQYLYGDSFLVAPIHRSGNQRTVLLPPGIWYDWFTREKYEGPAELLMEVPLERGIVFVREGAIVPMLRPSVDTLAPATEPGLESYANDPGILWVKVFPGAQEQSFTTIMGPELTVRPDGSGYKVTFKSVVPAFDGIRFEIDCLHLQEEAPAAMELTNLEGDEIPAAQTLEDLDACGACYYYDPASAILSVVPGAGTGGFDFGPV